MDQSRKTLLRVSAGFILFYIATRIIVSVLNIECHNHELHEIYEQLGFWGFIISVFVATYVMLPGQNTVTTVLLKMAFSFFIMFIALVFMVGILFADMCAWGTEKTLFKNKDNPSRKVVLRSYGCGATDSSSPTFTVFSERNIAGPWFLYTETDYCKN